MATALNTIKYYFPVLAALPDNTSTPLTQITLDLPESTKVFKSVIAQVTAHDIITVTGGTTATRTIALSVAGAGATTVTSSDTLTHSGENITMVYFADFTSHFVTNYTGTSHTVDVSLLIDQTTGTTLGFNNIVVSLTITYEYDTSSTTRTKTVYLPLNAPVGALATSKPGAAVATIPALDTELTESTKTYKQITLVVEGLTGTTIAGTDTTLSTEVDTLGVDNSAAIESALLTDRTFKHTVNWTTLFTTNATHSFYIWANVANFFHMQVYMVVTYTYDESASTTIYNSLLIPFMANGPNGFTTSTQAQRFTTEVNIQEPGTITTKNLAVLLNFQKAISVPTLSLRLGTGSYVSYSPGGSSVSAGTGGAMIRNDSAFTLARGNNVLSGDMYGNSSTTAFLTGCGGFFIVNYTSGKATAGSQVHNKTIMYNLNASPGGQGLAAIITPTPVSIPESEYYLNQVGVEYNIFPDGSPPAMGCFYVQAEKKTTDDEGIHEYVPLLSDPTQVDGEVGLIQIMTMGTNVFKRFPSQQVVTRLDIEASRAWRHMSINLQALRSLNMFLVYHNITYTISGTVTNSAGGTVNLYLHRASSGAFLRSTSRVGNGSFSFTWYDDTENVFVRAVESSTRKGLSIEATAATSLDVDLQPNGTRAYTG